MKIIPVIHYKDDDQAMANAELAFDKGCFGVFVIAMNRLCDPAVIDFLPKLKHRFPNNNIGVNFLSFVPEYAVEVAINCGADMSWSDYPVLRSDGGDIKVANAIQLNCSRANHIFFTSCSFKYQHYEPSPAHAAAWQTDFGFIPTTSGEATGEPTDIEKCRSIIAVIGDHEMAIASGITPANVRQYAEAGIGYGLVATGISSDFYNICEEKLEALLEQV